MSPLDPSSAIVPPVTPHDFVAPAQSVRKPVAGDSFFPAEPTTLEETGLTAGDIEALILKHLLTHGPTAGRKIAEQLKLPFGILQDSLRQAKAQMLVNYRGQGAMGDFEYDLSDEGDKRA